LANTNGSLSRTGWLDFCPGWKKINEEEENMSKSISGTIVITTMFFFTFLSTQSFGFTQGDVNQL